MEKITHCLLFPEQFSKPLQVKFDEPLSSSDGGAVLLRAADEKLGLSSSLATCLVDGRQAAKVQHSIEDLLRQRIYGLACGYADGNDAARLAADPIFKILLGRDPVTGAELPSQPTLSRFENTIGRKENYRLAQQLLLSILERQKQRRRKVRRITIDLDSTDDPTHGQQQFTFFNAHYDTYCYLPLLGFLSFDNEPESYLATAMLRPGNATEKGEHARVVVGLLSRLVGLVRAAFPKAMINVRLDGGFACPEMLDYLDSVPRLEYVCGLAKNAVLVRKAEPFMVAARKRAQAKKSPRVFGECRYAAQSWEGCQRRVIIKAEVVYDHHGEPKDNPRFVVTNKRQSAKFIYRKAYCSRGEIENRIKELHHGLEIDRTSCSNFWANQFRVTLTAAAYALMQEIRGQAKPTSLARAQVTTLREHLLKLSARVEASVRRIVLHLPQSFAYAREWTSIARRLGAVPT